MLNGFRWENNWALLAWIEFDFVFKGDHLNTYEAMRGALKCWIQNKWDRIIGMSKEVNRCFQC